MEKQEIENQIGCLKEQLNSLEQIITQNELKLKPEDYDELKIYEGQIRSANKSFDTEKYFVVCLGAAKAGKSTLLNALAERYVSHASPSAETTLHCSIIMAADEEHPEGITLYSLIKGKNDKDADEHIRLLLEYFKGTESWDNLKDTFMKSKPYTLYGYEASGSTMENLEYILTKRDPTKIAPHDAYFLAEIRVGKPNSNVLSNSVALIDMPGLDGITAVEDKKQILEYLPQCCHHFLLVQSSVTALNCTTKDALVKIVGCKRETPLWVVYNEIRSKSEWHKPEAMDKERETQITRAKKELSHLTDNMQNGVLIFNLNAAMAWESCDFSHYEQDLLDNITASKLSSMSNIESLKQHLITQIDEQRKKTILLDALDHCINLNTNFQKEGRFQSKIDQLQTEIEGLEREKNDWQDCRTQIGRICDNVNRNERKRIETLLRQRFIELLEDSPDNTRDGIITKISKIKVNVPFQATKKKYNEDDQKELIDTFLSNFQQELSLKLSEEPFVSKTVEKLTGDVENFKNEISKVVKKVIHPKSDVHGAQEDKFLPQCKTNDFFENLNLKDLVSGIFTYQSIEDYFDPAKRYKVPKRKMCGVVPYLGNTQTEDSMNDYFKNMQSEYYSQLSSNLQGKVCNEFVEKVVRNFIEHLEQIKIAFENDYQQWRDSSFRESYDNCKNFKDLLVDLKKNTDEIEQACQRFKSDLKHQ